MNNEAENRAHLLDRLRDLRLQVYELERALAAGSRSGLELIPPGNGATTGVMLHKVDLLLENAGFPMVFFDGEGTLLFVGRLAGEYLDEPPDELVGRSIDEIFSPPNARRCRERILQLMERGHWETYEDHLLLPIGERWFWSVWYPVHSPEGEPLGVHVVLHDITERKRAHAALQERLRFERLIAAISSDYVQQPASAMGPATERALRSLGRYIGVDRILLFWFSEDYESLGCMHEWHDEGVASVIAGLQHRVREQFPWVFERFCEGQFVVVPRISEMPDEARAERQELQDMGVKSLVAAPMTLAGRVVGVLCFESVQVEREWSDELLSRLRLVGEIIANAIERMHAERTLSEQREHLAHVARLGALGEMVAGVAHELSQPLYTIVNFSKAVENLLATPEPTDLQEAREWNRRIVASAARAGEILHRLRDFARRSGVKRVESRLDDVLDESIDLMAFTARRQQVAVECDCGVNETLVKVDRVQIQQVFVNLIQNAIEALQADPADSRRVSIRALRDGESVQFSVADNGPGLPAEPDPLFNAFFTTKPGGLGMGLAICKTIVEDHGGRLWAQPNAPRGATFHFTLPIFHSESEHE